LATRRTARPLGTVVVESLHGGTLDGCDPSWPGPVGYPRCNQYAGEREHAAAHVRLGDGGERAGQGVASAWITFDLHSLPTGESLPARARGALRIVHGDSRDVAVYRVLQLASIDAATMVASRLADHPASCSSLRELSARMGAAQVDWVARQLVTGELKILWRLREPATRPQAAAPERAAPTPRAVARPASAPTPVDQTFPPDLDVPAIAQSLKNAAADGVPFCEECTKAQQQQQQNAAAETA
jgi:hypothetical protein